MNNSDQVPRSAHNRENLISTHLDALTRAFSLESRDERIEASRTALRELLAVMAQDLSHELLDAEGRTNYEGRTMRQLATASRRRTDRAKVVDAIAHQLIIGAMLNHDNPSWDPLDPSTHKPNFDSGLVQILMSEGQK